jgi:hypothetical protein
MACLVRSVAVFEELLGYKIRNDRIKATGGVSVGEGPMPKSVFE